ncbi:hypothetical protein DIPPA_09876 [Diplonema papillatum]|nr:hypothetical protein DIPPA_09876 [Diplonema papillatum]
METAARQNKNTVSEEKAHEKVNRQAESAQAAVGENKESDSAPPSENAEGLSRVWSAFSETQAGVTTALNDVMQAQTEVVANVSETLNAATSTTMTLATGKAQKQDPGDEEDREKHEGRGTRALKLQAAEEQAKARIAQVWRSKKSDLHAREACEAGEEIEAQADGVRKETLHEVKAREKWCQQVLRPTHRPEDDHKSSPAPSSPSISSSMSATTFSDSMGSSTDSDTSNDDHEKGEKSKNKKQRQSAGTDESRPEGDCTKSRPSRHEPQEPVSPGCQSTMDYFKYQKKQQRLVDDEQKPGKSDKRAKAKASEKEHSQKTNPSTDKKKTTKVTVSNGPNKLRATKHGPRVCDKDALRSKNPVAV